MQGTTRFKHDFCLLSPFALAFFSPSENRDGRNPATGISLVSDPIRHIQLLEVTLLQSELSLI